MSHDWCSECEYEYYERSDEPCISCMVAYKNEPNQFKPKRPPTNADRIRTMTDEELSYFLYKVSLNVLIGTPARGALPKDWLDWLRKEADNG